jgi:hypothetical protein
VAAQLMSIIRKGNSVRTEMNKLLAVAVLLASGAVSADTCVFYTPPTVIERGGEQCVDGGGGSGIAALEGTTGFPVFRINLPQSATSHIISGNLHVFRNGGDHAVGQGMSKSEAIARFSHITSDGSYQLGEKKVYLRHLQHGTNGPWRYRIDITSAEQSTSQWLNVTATSTG